MNNGLYEEHFQFSKLPFERLREAIHIQSYFESVWYDDFTYHSSETEIAVYYWIRSGCAVRRNNDGRQQRLPAGYFVAASGRTQTPCSISIAEGPWVRQCIIVDRNPFYDFLIERFCPLDDELIFLHEPLRVERIFDEIRLALQKTQEDSAEHSALFVKLLCELNGQKPPQPRPEALRIALDHILLHYRDPLLNKTAIADAAGVSLRGLERLFRQNGETPPQKQIMELRLKYAQNLLSNSTLSIKEIAEKSGFSNANYFSRFFRQHLGETPQIYRQKNQFPLA